MMKIVSAIIVICAVTVAAEECTQDTHPHHKTKGTPAPLQSVKLRSPYKVWNISISSHETCLYLRPSAVVVSACDSEAAPSVEAVSLQLAYVVRNNLNITTDASVFVTVYCESVFKPFIGVVATPVLYSDDYSTSKQDLAADIQDDSCE